MPSHSGKRVGGGEGPFPDRKVGKGGQGDDTKPFLSAAKQKEMEKDNSGGKQASYFIASFLLSEKELRDNNPLVCVASKRKELVECKKSMKRTYRR